MDLNTVSQRMRAHCLRMGLAAGSQGIHLGSSMSCIEIMVALYFGCQVIDPDRPDAVDRDRVILSKGHGVPAQYAAFVELGLVGEEELDAFKHTGGRLTGHPSLDSGIGGIEFSSGSLGQGLSLGVGLGLALRHKRQTKPRVFVLLGDGECDEGSVWEAAMSASHFGLDNLFAIVDENQLQYDGFTREIMNLGSLASKFEAFGWNVVIVDGHDIDALTASFCIQRLGKPTAVIARTLKGKGIPFAEGCASWHHGRLSQDLYHEAMNALHFGEGGEC